MVEDVLVCLGVGFVFCFVVVLGESEGVGGELGICFVCFFVDG